MKISVISFTRAGAVKNLEVVGLLQEKKHQAASFSWHKYTGRKLIPFQKLDQLLTDLWDKQDAFLFLSDTELAMRAIVPHITGPKEGPAVFVMDEQGQFVLPLVSGSFVGAQDWCMQFARAVGAVGVNTKNAEPEIDFSLEQFVQVNLLHVQDIYRIRNVKEQLTAGKIVGIYSDYPIEGVLPEGFIPYGKAAGKNAAKTVMPEVGISITDDWEAPRFAKECRMYPKNLVIALYCDKGKNADELERFVSSALTEKHLSKERVRAVFSLEEKSQEEGLLLLADRLAIPYFTYSVKQLNGKEKKEKESNAGHLLSALCDRCAVLGSHQGKLLISHKMADGMMISVCEQAVELTF